MYQRWQPIVVCGRFVHLKFKLTGTWHENNSLKFLIDTFCF